MLCCLARRLDARTDAQSKYYEPALAVAVWVICLQLQWSLLRALRSPPGCWTAAYTCQLLHHMPLQPLMPVIRARCQVLKWCKAQIHTVLPEAATCATHTKAMRQSRQEQMGCCLQLRQRSLGHGQHMPSIQQNNTKPTAPSCMGLHTLRQRSAFYALLLLLLLLCPLLAMAVCAVACCLCLKATCHQWLMGLASLPT